MNDTSTDDKETTQKSPHISVPQVTAGAMAAATAAIVGSQLGVAGTVLGAAVGSVASAVAGTIYQVGIEKTHHQLRHLATGTHRVRGVQPTPQARVDVVPVDGGPDSMNTDAPRGTLPTGDAGNEPPGDTLVDVLRTDADSAGPVGDGEATTILPAGSGATGVDQGDTGTSADLPQDDPQPTRRRWPVIVGTSLASAAAAFAIGFGAITGFEALTGQAISGGQGTTIGQIANASQARRSPQPSVSPSAAESQAGPTSSATPTQSASQGVPSDQPSTTAPTSEPTATTPQATPTSNVTPTTGTSPAGLSKASTTNKAAPASTPTARSAS